MVDISSTIIKTVLDFYMKVRGEDEVWIKFKKKDGSDRIMNCTLNFDKVPTTKRPKDVNLQRILELIQKHKLMNVFDLEKQDWRSIPFSRVVYLETPKTDSSERIRYNIQK